MSLRSVLEPLLSCPITFEILQDPVTTPCGHTFERSLLIKSFAIDSLCPMDRRPVLPKDLRENLLVKQLLLALDNVTSLFLHRHDKAPRFLERCVMTQKPLLGESASLPCSRHRQVYHDEATLVFSSVKRLHPEEAFDGPYSLESLEKRGWEVSCTLCNDTYTTAKVSRMGAEFTLRNQAAYAQHLKDLEAFNRSLNNRINELPFDNRDFLKALFCCPLSGKQLENPVLAPCGHTFDRSSLLAPDQCPFDKAKLLPSEVIPNFLIASCLEKTDLLFNSIFCGLEGEKDMDGVWLHLDKSLDSRTVDGIAQQLEFFDDLPEGVPGFWAEKEAMSIIWPLKFYESILQKNPVLTRCFSIKSKTLIDK